VSCAVARALAQLIIFHRQQVEIGSSSIKNKSPKRSSKEKEKSEKRKKSKKRKCPKIQKSKRRRKKKRWRERKPFVLVKNSRRILLVL